MSADFGYPDAPERVWDEAVAWRGRVDVLINNAAILIWHGGIDEDVGTWDAIWGQTLQVNLLAPARLMHRAVKHFREHSGGVIVTISSWVVHRGVSNPDTMAYGASKAAVRSMTQSIARNYARQGVLAYAMHRGW